jgi:hypothetical protein
MAREELQGLSSALREGSHSGWLGDAAGCGIDPPDGVGRSWEILVCLERR